MLGAAADLRGGRRPEAAPPPSLGSAPWPLERRLRPSQGGACRTVCTQEVLPDEADIGDGDQLCVLRLDGLDPLINWGTGGMCGHTVMALRFDGALHIVESQAKSGYWPKDFVQRNPWKTWLEYARQADYHVAHLRLSAAARARFNATAARLAFETKYADYHPTALPSSPPPHRLSLLFRHLLGRHQHLRPLRPHRRLKLEGSFATVRCLPPTPWQVRGPALRLPQYAVGLVRRPHR